MKTIYYISGLGADERAFTQLKLPEQNWIYLPWLMPEKREPIDHYAARMAENITEPNPVLMGLSFGGMMSIEIAKQLPVHQVILISSIKSRSELPRWMRLAGNSRINRFISMQSYPFLEPIQNRFLGVTNEAERTIANHFRRTVDPVYLNWAIDAVLNWENTKIPSNIHHIHGDRDHIFPIKNIQATHVIPGGGHFMIMNKALAISSLLPDILGIT